VLLAFIQMAGVLAQNESPLVPITGYGAIGIIAGLFIIGRIVPSSTTDKAEARADRAESRAETMLDDYKAVVPVLQQAIAAIQTADQARQAQAAQDAEMRVLLGQVRDALTQRGR
jgi:hypothetical protein